LNISALSPSHAASEFTYWQLAAYTSPSLDDGKKYWLYAKVSATNQTGTFYLSETAKAFNADSIYYYLWIGFINSAYNGVRTDFVNVYGFTEILPGQITTNVIRDPDANLVIDLANAIITTQNGTVIQGKLAIQANSSGYGNLTSLTMIMRLTI